VKIALIVPGGVDRSGERRVVPALLALIRRLATRHEVHVFALRQEPRPGEWELLGARVHNIGGRLPRLAVLSAIRREHIAQPFQVLQAIWSGACGLSAVLAARTLGLPSLVHVAGVEVLRLPQIHVGGRLTMRGRAQEAVVRRAATLITANSAPMVAALEALGRRARRVPLGVDLDEWAPCEPARRAMGPARLIHVASLNRVKDQPTLLRAFAEVLRRGIDAQLDIVGEDTLGGAVQRLAAELGLARCVRFHGFLTQRELHPFVARSHLMVLSSLHEAGPSVMLEAAVCGVPTVGTAVGHIAEWSPRAALAAPVGDFRALADAIERLLADEDLRLRTAAEAARRAREEDADHTARSFESLYEELGCARD
jgi:glycosyltransferase involved in cell wall biosynthesis